MSTYVCTNLICTHECATCIHPVYTFVLARSLVNRHDPCQTGSSFAMGGWPSHEAHSHNAAGVLLTVFAATAGWVALSRWRADRLELAKAVAQTHKERTGRTTAEKALRSALQVCPPPRTKKMCMRDGPRGVLGVASHLQRQTRNMCKRGVAQP